MDYTPPPYGAPNPLEQPEPPQMSGRRGKRKKKGETDDAAPTKKVVDRSLKLAIAFAAGTALIGGAIVYGGTGSSTYVVRASQNIAAGTPINVETMLETVAAPDELVQDGALSATSEAAALELAREEIAGMHAQYPIATGQQIHPQQFNVEFALSEPLKSNERLLSVQATVANAVAGQIASGDRVDIAASTESVAGVVLSDVEVVSVTVSENQYQAIADQQTGEHKNTRPEELLPGDPVPGIYVLRVSSLDAPKLLAAAAGADLTLVYRPDGADTLPVEPMTALQVICGVNPADLPVCTDL